MQQNNMQQEVVTTTTTTFLIVGGGIAGVTCAETLAICCPKESILLLTESSIIKTVANLQPVARYLHKFDVQEVTATAYASTAVGAGCIITLVDQLQSIQTQEQLVRTRSNRRIKYKYLCLCTGAEPQLIANGNARVLGIRDTDSVLQLQQRLQHASSVLLVGNGGIASELAFELQGVQLHWVVKDNHIASTFVDAGAAYFFQATKTAPNTAKVANSAVKRLRYAEVLQDTQQKTHAIAAALGPDWQKNFTLSGKLDATQNSTIMHYKAQVQSIDEAAEKLIVQLTTGEQIACDFVVSATGVNPRHDFSCDEEFVLAADAGIAVSEMMQTNLPNIYAAGDCCTASWPSAPHWFQMRLWTQARQMGAMAGRSMAAAHLNESIYQDFCFELFGHVTKLFGYEVVLLGRYNGQGLGTDYEILLRSTPGKEYIKFVLQNGHLRGAMLIGNTELAETCENLILNGIDLTPFGDDILNPDIDIEDYFD